MKKSKIKTSPVIRLTKGFSLIELVVSVAITSLLLLSVYRFFIEARFQMESGFYRLESLAEARMAIDYLRRDFSTACPFISKNADTTTKDPEHEFAAKNLVRRMVFFQNLAFIQPPQIRPGMDLAQKQSFPLKYAKGVSSQLSFFHFCYRPSKSNTSPTVERVEYSFDSKTKTLLRQTADQKQTFSGMENVSFRFYVPEWSKKTVMLRINMSVKTVPKHLKGQIASTILEISTTVNSQFISSNLLDPSWNFEGYQDKI